MLNSSKNEQNEYRFIVIDEPKNGFGGDQFEEVYDSLDDANSAAKSCWYHLTKGERRKRHIWVGISRRENLDDAAFDEDTGEVICWSMDNGYGFEVDDTMFDSEEYERHDVYDYEEIQKHMLPEAERLVPVWEGQKDSEFLERYNEAHKLITGKDFGIFCGGNSVEDFEIYDEDDDD